MNEVLAARGQMDVPVNDPGINRRGNILAITAEDRDATIAVNVDTMVHLCRAVLPQMMARGGGDTSDLGRPAPFGRIGKPEKVAALDAFL